MLPAPLLLGRGELGRQLAELVGLHSKLERVMVELGSEPRLGKTPVCWLSQEQQAAVGAEVLQQWPGLEREPALERAVVL
jgi:hypothetical protein